MLAIIALIGYMVVFTAIALGIFLGFRAAKII
ncbi:MAG: hypothetical protein N5P05_003768 [Chroococcopsis gigantea SAG 12.99]|nr:cytochrome b6-f complex subunit PetL [Chlorogloea purpurea SAG 13.99]MDV3002162.1 hypothetical protein [Chroococcopsis gigantea SAG 12.99]